MTSLYNSTIFLLLVIVCLFNLIFFLNYKKIFIKLNLYDYPDKKRKIHKKPISLAGGPIIYLNLLLMLIFTMFLQDQQLDNFYIFSIKNFFIFLVSISLIFFAGLYDDKFTLSPTKRLLIISISIYLLLVTDNTLILQELFFSFSNYNIKTNSLAFLFTLICFISLILALNMFDGMNLQAGIFYLLFFTFFVIVTKNFYILAILVPLLLFTYLNFKNKLFLGDSGSYLLSLLVAFFSIKLYKYDSLVFSDHIFIILFLPILDSIRVTLLRVTRGRKIFNPDRTHFHHLLLNKYSYNFTILIISLFFLIPYISFFLKINSILTITIISFLYFYLLKKK